MSQRIDLLRYATISADLAEGDRPLADVLQTHGVTADAWTAANREWADRMATDARDSALLGVPPRVTLDFAEAFADAQDRKRPLLALDPKGWWTLKRDVDARGPKKALAERGLRLADYTRLVRFWAKAAATDPAVRDALAAFEDAAAEGV